MGSAKIGKGTQFRHTYADGNPLWEITGRQGRDAWKAVIVNEPFEFEGRKIDSDFAGVVQVFTDAQVKAAVGWEDIFRANMAGHDVFYASLRVGQWVHYEDGNGSYIRCEAALEGGKKVLKPIALVGRWDKFDLPRRNRDGSIYNGIAADKVLKRQTMTPNYSNIWEATPVSKRKGLDPTSMRPVDLSVPEMTPEEAVVAKQWQAVNAAYTVLNATDTDPMVKLQALMDVVTAALPKPAAPDGPAVFEVTAIGRASKSLAITATNADGGLLMHSLHVGDQIKIEKV